MLQRVIVIVCDGLGIGELPDARNFGDEGSNTLAHVAKEAGPLRIPCLTEMGLGRLGDLWVPPCSSPIGSFGKMAEVSPAKDSITGHWEMMGCVVETPFPTYPNGFPPEVIEPLKKEIGREILGNIPASGTFIIERFGEEHLRTGAPIVYTSADSVFQIAAHEEVIPVQELYHICEAARRILVPPHHVARVIARPFTGKLGSFVRTPQRKDFSLPPPRETLLDHLQRNRIPVIGIGKIGDLFARRGITEDHHPPHNREGIATTLSLMERVPLGLLFLNLGDFDTLYGHRNDPIGYAHALEEFDVGLRKIMRKCRDEDLLVITADHGNDPTTPSTDHSREYVPLLVYGKKIRAGVDLGIRKSFADLGQTLAALFHTRGLTEGDSFLEEVRIA